VLELAGQRGQRIIGVPSDEHGLRLEALEAACKAYQPRLIYLVPTFGNPTGATLQLERRERLLRLARDHRLLVVEDDVYGFLSWDSPAPPALKSLDRDTQVVYLTSFSKVLAPALRLGALVASPSLLPALAAAKQSADLVCSTLLQRALADYLRRGHMAAHLQLVRRLYSERRDVMLAALERHMPGCSWTDPAGGLSLWVTLPKEVVERDFVADAIERGVGVAPGRAFFPQPQPGGYMRLSFGLHPSERIEAGVATLGRVLQAHRHRRSDMLSPIGRAAGPLV
jgi:2-aminoadipate transaminase